MLVVAWPGVGASVNQSDRLTGMAEYINASADAIPWLSLLIILLGLVLVIVLLRWANQRQHAKAKAKLARAKDDKAKAQSRQSKVRRPSAARVRRKR